MAGTVLRHEMDHVPLWRGDHVAIQQLVEDFARYLYLPRLKDPSVLLGAVRDGGALLTWERDAFAFADSFDEAADRYKGLRGGQQIDLIEALSPGLLVKPLVARGQLDAETPQSPASGHAGPEDDGDRSLLPGESTDPAGGTDIPPGPAPPKRFHGTVALDPTRVGRDASRIAEEIISHLAGLVGAKVTVTLEIEAEIPTGAPDHVVRTVTENSQTLKFTSHGFEGE